MSARALMVLGTASHVGKSILTAALVPLVKPTAAPELRDRFHEAVTRGYRSIVPSSTRS